MKTKHLKILLLLCPIAVFWGFNHENIPLQFSLLLGLIAFPYVMIPEAQSGGFRYAILAAITGLILVFFRSSSLYYFSTAFILLFVLDKWWGRLNHLPLLLTIIVSPVISNIVYIWSFPIRLKLSHWAALVLQTIQMDIKANGNILVLEGHTFAVDPACIGLKMVVSSLVLGIIMIAYFSKKHKRTLPPWKSLLLMGSILFGAILCNFIRLLTLIIFHILPGNPMHDVIGLVSLGVYVLLPFYFLVRFIYKRTSGKETIPSSIKDDLAFKKPKWQTYSILVFLGLLQIFNGKQFLQSPTENIEAIQNVRPKGLTQEITSNGVLKLQNQEALIYVKPPVRFFQGSHDPRFCWQGSGYTFSEVQLESIEGKSLYTAILKKEEDQIYTAWWYENSSSQTPHEWDWRWKSLLGNGGFYMINVSCSDRPTLKKWIGKNVLE